MAKRTIKTCEWCGKTTGGKNPKCETARIAKTSNVMSGMCLQYASSAHKRKRLHEYLDLALNATYANEHVLVEFSRMILEAQQRREINPLGPFDEPEGNGSD